MLQIPNLIAWPHSTNDIEESQVQHGHRSLALVAPSKSCPGSRAFPLTQMLRLENPEVSFEVFSSLPLSVPDQLLPLPWSKSSSFWALFTITASPWAGRREFSKCRKLMRWLLCLKLPSFPRAPATARTSAHFLWRARPCVTEAKLPF